jgi:hypothetical protein
LLRASIRIVAQRLKALDYASVCSLIDQQVATNNDASDRAQKWREKLEADLTQRVLKRAVADAAAPIARDTLWDRAAVLGDVYSIENQAVDESVKSGQDKTHFSEQERVMRIFYAATNTDAALERDAVRSFMSI